MPLQKNWRVSGVGQGGILEPSTLVKLLYVTVIYINVVRHDDSGNMLLFCKLKLSSRL